MREISLARRKSTNAIFTSARHIGHKDAAKRQGENC